MEIILSIFKLQYITRFINRGGWCKNSNIIKQGCLRPPWLDRWEYQLFADMLSLKIPNLAFTRFENGLAKDCNNSMNSLNIMPWLFIVHSIYYSIAPSQELPECDQFNWVALWLWHWIVLNHMIIRKIHFTKQSIFHPINIDFGCSIHTTTKDWGNKKYGEAKPPESNICVLFFRHIFLILFFLP